MLNPTPAKGGKRFVKTKLFNILSEVDSKSYKKIKECIKNGENVFERGNYDETYLHVLCAPTTADQLRYVVPLIYYLVNLGIDINSKDKEGNTVLHVCALNNLELDVCAALLRLGADPSEKNAYDQEASDLSDSDELKNLIKYYQPGICEAIKRNQETTLRKLVDAWCAVDINGNGQALMNIAQVHKDQKIYEYLKNVKDTSQLISKALSGDHRQVKSLLKQNSDGVIVDADVRDGYIYEISGRRWPLLAEVLRLQLWDSAKALAKYADVNQVVDSVDGYTFPLFEWVIKCVPEIKLSFLKTMISKADLSNVNSLDMLHDLCQRDYPPEEILASFVSAGFSLSTRNADGLTFRELQLRESYSLTATELRREMYMVDQHVIAMARRGDILQLQELFLDGYEYILVYDEVGKSIVEVALEEGQDEVYQFLSSLPELQVCRSIDHWLFSLIPG